MGELDLSLRNASAHEDYEVVEDGVILKPTTHPQKLTFNKFTDRQLHDLEVVYANHLAPMIAADEHGVSLFTPDAFMILGLDQQEMLSIVLEMWRWKIGYVEIRDSVAYIAADLPNDVAFAPSLFSAITAAALQSVGFVQAAIKNDNGADHVLSGPISTLSKINTDPDGYVVFAASWRLDGHSLVSRPFLRNWITCEHTKVLNEDITSAMPRLRQLRDIARLTDDDESASMITRLMTITRTGGSISDADNRNVLDFLSASLSTWSTTPSQSGLLINLRSITERS